MFLPFNKSLIPFSWWILISEEKTSTTAISFKLEFLLNYNGSSTQFTWKSNSKKQINISAGVSQMIRSFSLKMFGYCLLDLLISWRIIFEVLFWERLCYWMFSWFFIRHLRFFSMWLNRHLMSLKSIGPSWRGSAIIVVVLSLRCLSSKSFKC